MYRALSKLKNQYKFSCKFSLAAFKRKVQQISVAQVSWIQVIMFIVQQQHKTIPSYSKEKVVRKSLLHKFISQQQLFLQNTQIAASQISDLMVESRSPDWDVQTLTGFLPLTSSGTAPLLSSFSVGKQPNWALGQFITAREGGVEELANGGLAHKYTRSPLVIHAPRVIPCCLTLSLRVSGCLHLAWL